MRGVSPSRLATIVRPSRATFWILLSLVALAAAVRFRGLAFGLPHTQARPDETAIIDTTRTLLSGHLPEFYDYPWLYMWMLAASYTGYFLWGFASGSFHSIGDMLASWPTHWEPFFLISRAISASFGTATALVVFRLGRQVRDEATGLVAALFVAVGIMHARNSHFGTTDVAMLFFALCSVSLLIDAHQTRSRRLYLAAGAAGGLAAATKYNAVLLLASILASWILLIVESRDGRRAAWKSRAPIAFGVAFALAFGIGVPFVVVDRERFMIGVHDLFRSLAEGTPQVALAPGWIHHLQFSLRYGMGMPELIAGLAGALLLLVTSPRLAWLLLAFPVASYLVAGSVGLRFFRYALPVIPFLDVTAAYLVVYVSQAVAQRIALPGRRAIAAAVVAAVAALAIAWPAAANVLAFDRVLAQTDNRVVIAEWFEQHVPSGDSVLQSGGRYGLVQFDRRLGLHEWRWDSARKAFMLDGARAAGRPDWILLQDSPLPSATQPVVTEFLKDDYTLVTTFKAFTPDADMVYDREDAFYVPYTGLEYVERPGPNFTLYRRSGESGNREPQHDGR